MKCCLVTICIGKKYIRQYNKLFRPSQEKYAKNSGYDFKVITDYIKEPKNPYLISLNKILVCDYNWEKEYDFIIFIDADIIINDNTPPIHNQYNFGDKIGVVSESQPTIEARIEQIKHLGRSGSITASKYYKRRSGHIFKTDHVINTGVLVIQPKKHKLFLRNIFDTYFEKQIFKKTFHFEQSAIGAEIQINDLHYFMDMKWNAVWGNNKYYYNTMKKQSLTLQDFYNQNYFIHLAGRIDFDLVPSIK